MQIKDYFLLTKNRLIKNKSHLACVSLVYAFSMVLACVLSSVVVGIINSAAQENLFFNIYTSFENNKVKTIGSFVFLFGTIMAIIIALYNTLKETSSRKTEYKNKMMIGASYTNLVVESLIENIIMFILGTVAGFAISYLAIFVIGAILDIVIMFNTYTFVAVFIIEFILVIVGTIIPVLWTTTEDKQK